MSDPEQQPTSRTDFSTWKRETLERFARQSADENLTLRRDLTIALAGWRKAVTDNLKDKL